MFFITVDEEIRLQLVSEALAPGQFWVPCFQALWVPAWEPIPISRCRVSFLG